MKIFKKASDGGENSGVTGYFLVEIKSLFSIVLLHFNNGTREAFHSHAFNALTLWLKGCLIEHQLNGKDTYWVGGQIKYTSRSCFHKVESVGESWALSLRGPWHKNWQEYKSGELVTLTHGRKTVTNKE